MREGTASKLIAGLDVGDRYTQFYVIDGAGRQVEESRVRTVPAAMTEHFRRAPMRVALEVGTHSPWLSRLLEELGHEVFVANARKVRLIYATGRKNDRLDARALARLARLDPHLLCSIQHRSEQAQADLDLLRSRDVLVRTRTRLITHMRGQVKSLGSRLPATSARSFHRKTAEALPPLLREVLLPLYDVLEQVDRQIRDYDRRIEAVARERYPAALRLAEIPGVGILTALCFVLVLHDPTRFRKSRAVGPYIGLAPRQAQSGERERQLGISSAGDELLRRLLVQAAHYQMGPFGCDSDLRRWGLERAARGGPAARKRAVVAVARRLAVAMHRIWITGESYRPLRQMPRVA